MHLAVARSNASKEEWRLDAGNYVDSYFRMILMEPIWMHMGGQKNMISKKITFRKVVKCDDRACCANVQSSVRYILSERFIIPPYPILQSSSGVSIPKPQERDAKTYATFLLSRSLEITPTL
ncbi:unnamed protein product [Pieris macdunnoughi]|uniref:Uncharacterized protein n=1 Tax=Pieris macdunnoughi TaxID=345717 RepID=A0A821XZH8_9NEOP|nr:unnamed protein product [Pieris macdunnoughi]